MTTTTKDPAVAAAVDRTPKPCLHKQAAHQHGDRATYVLDRCRCLPCAHAASVYEETRRKRNAYGRANLVDAAPARDHVAALVASGVGLKYVAKRSGVAHGALWKLMYGKTRPDGSRTPSLRITRQTADRLLALTVGDPALLADGARTSSVGTARRLQALACSGWSIARLSTDTGIDRQRLDQAISGGRVVASTVRAVAAVYEQLWDQPAPEGDHRERISVSRSRRRAEASGWLPPLAWDDDTIDDPTAQPATALAEVDDEDWVDEHAVDLVLDAQPMHLTGRTLEVAVERLAATGLTAASIAARVRSTEPTVRRIRNTAGVRAARAGSRAEVAA